MVDQCKHCTARGLPDECATTDCSLHDSWFAERLNGEYGRSKAECERLDKLATECAAELVEADATIAGLRAKLEIYGAKVFLDREPNRDVAVTVMVSNRSLRDAVNQAAVIKDTADMVARMLSEYATNEIKVKL